MSTEIQNAAASLAQARAEAAKAAEALDRAKAAQRRVQERVDGLGAERARIVAAARTAASDAQAALRLEVVTADLRDLSQLVSEHAAIVAKAQADADAANAAVVRAQPMLDMAADSDLLGRLVEHAGKLDGLLLATVREIAAIDKRGGRRPSWAPSPDVYAALTKLHLTRQAMR